jgi:hypothetical protein
MDQIKEGYRQSNKNNATVQILNSFVRINNFRMFDLKKDNGREAVIRPLKAPLLQLCSPTSSKLVSSVQAVATYCNLPQLAQSIETYYKRTLDDYKVDATQIATFPGNHYQILRVPFTSFQDMD